MNPCVFRSTRPAPLCEDLGVKTRLRAQEASFFQSSQVTCDLKPATEHCDETDWWGRLSSAPSPGCDWWRVSEMFQFWEKICTIFSQRVVAGVSNTSQFSVHWWRMKLKCDKNDNLTFWSCKTRPTYQFSLIPCGNCCCELSQPGEMWLFELWVFKLLVLIVFALYSFFQSVTETWSRLRWCRDDRLADNDTFSCWSRRMFASVSADFDDLNSDVIKIKKLCRCWTPEAFHSAVIVISNPSLRRHFTTTAHVDLQM